MYRPNEFSPAGEDVIDGSWVADVQMNSSRGDKGPDGAKPFDRITFLQKIPVPMRETNDIGVGGPWYREPRKYLPDQGLDSCP